MSDSYLTYLGSNKLDAEFLTVGANDVYRERMQITGAAAAEISRVQNTAQAGTEYGLVVRPIPFVPTSFDHISKSSIGTSALQFTASSTALKMGAWVIADPANTAPIYVGNSDVTAGGTAATDGAPLYPGGRGFVAIDNLNKIYMISTAAGQKAFAIYW